MWTRRKPLRQLQDENLRLTKLVVDLTIGKETLKAPIAKT
jgi:hypothetical protein